MPTATGHDSGAWALTPTGERSSSGMASVVAELEPVAAAIVGRGVGRVPSPTFPALMHARVVGGVGLRVRHVHLLGRSSNGGSGATRDRKSTRLNSSH